MGHDVLRGNDLGIARYLVEQDLEGLAPGQVLAVGAKVIEAEAWVSHDRQCRRACAHGPMIEIRSPLARLAVSFRAIALLALIGGGLGLALGIVTIRGSLEPFFTANQIGPPARRFTLIFIFGVAAAFAAVGVGFLLKGRGRADAAGILYGIA